MSHHDMDVSSPYNWDYQDALYPREHSFFYMEVSPAMPDVFQEKLRRPELATARFARRLPSLMEQLALAKRAGAVLAPVLKQFHIATNFRDPSNCRIDEARLILIVDSASQENRIRQLKPRLLKLLAESRLEIADIDVHVRPATNTPLPVDELAAPSEPPRPRSALGSESLARVLTDIKDDRLRETLARLSATLAPSPETLKSHLEHAIGESTMRIAEENLALAAEREELLREREALTPESGLTLERKTIPTAVTARLAALRSQIEQRLEEIERQCNANNTALGELQSVDRWLESDPPRAAALLATHLAQRQAWRNAAPAPEPSPAATVSGAVAVSALAEQTEDWRLRRSLVRLAGAISPREDDYESVLKDNIRSEMSTLEARAEAGNRKAQQRLAQLSAALAELALGTTDAHSLAQALYAGKE